MEIISLLLLQIPLSIKEDSGSPIQAASTGGRNTSGLIPMAALSEPYPKAAMLRSENVSVSTADMSTNSKASFGGLVVGEK
ncbi:MAG: hypothetical protein ACLU6Y_16205 [Ruminococcus sp.]